MGAGGSCGVTRLTTSVGTRYRKDSIGVGSMSRFVERLTSDGAYLSCQPGSPATTFEIAEGWGVGVGGEMM